MPCGTTRRNSSSKSRNFGRLFLVRPPMNRFLAFGLHIGDIGKRDHPKMDSWVFDLNKRLCRCIPAAKIVAWFDKSGNFVIDAEPEVAMVIAENLRGASERLFAVFPLADLHTWTARLRNSNPPPHKDGFRWTLGASFRIGSYPCIPLAEEWETKNGSYFPLTQDIIGVWKQDRLEDSASPRSKLDRKNRNPWGVIGKDIESKFGGRWTSRSKKTISGLVLRARTVPNWNPLEPRRSG